MSNRGPGSPSLFSVVLLGALAGGLWLALSSRSVAPTEPVVPASNSQLYPAERQPRPELRGRDLTFGSQHFLVHYTDDGDGAVPAGDSDGDGVPDFVVRVAEAMEQSREIQLGRMGFAPPPGDGGLGGDDRFDVYLLPIDYFGFTAGMGGVVGDNPNTPEVENRAAFSYMAMDNTFAAYHSLYGVPVMDALGITSAHEFNHAVHYGYDPNDELWLFESSAALVEALQYPWVRDNIGYLIAQAENPDQCLPDARIFEHPYSHWHFLGFLIEHHPSGEHLLSRVWESARELDGLFALDDALDGALDAYWSNWLVANLVREDCPIGGSYCMTGARLYPPVLIEGRMSPFDWDGVVRYSPPDGVGSFGVDYIDLTPFNAARIPLDLAVIGQTEGVDLRARLIGFGDSDRPEVINIPIAGDPASGTARFDPTAYSRLYLSVENHTPSLEANCGRVELDYSVVVSRPGQEPVLDSSALSIPALAAPGESFDVKLNLRSLLVDEPSASLTVRLPMQAEWVGEAQASMGTLRALDNRTLEWTGRLGGQPITLVASARLAEGLPGGSRARIDATLASPYAGVIYEMSGVIQTPQALLLVEDTGPWAGETILPDLLREVGVGVDVWNTLEQGSPTPETLAMYSGVIWNTASSNVQTLVAEDRDALAGYLTSGGRLLLVGSDLVYELTPVGTPESRRFLYETLGVAFVDNSPPQEGTSIGLGSTAGTEFVLAVPGRDPLDPEAGGFPDVVAPVDGQSSTWLSYPGGGSAAVISDDGSVLLLAFDLVQIDSSQRARVLVEALRAVGMDS